MINWVAPVYKSRIFEKLKRLVSFSLLSEDLLGSKHNLRWWVWPIIQPLDPRHPNFPGLEDQCLANAWSSIRAVCILYIWIDCKLASFKHPWILMPLRHTHAIHIYICIFNLFFLWHKPNKPCSLSFPATARRCASSHWLWVGPGNCQEQQWVKWPNSWQA